AAADMTDDPQTHAILLSEIALAQVADQATTATTFRKARNIAGSIESLSLRGRTLAAIALAQTNAGDRSAAELTLKEALLAAESSKNGAPDAYLLVAKVQVALGDRAAADATFDGMLNGVNALASDFARGGLLIQIAAAQAAVGDHGGAANTLE